MTRKELKQRAKERFKFHYGMAILAILLPFVILSAASSIVVGVIFLMPIMVGQAYMYLSFDNDAPTEINALFKGFKSDIYLKNVLTLFLKGLFIFLWTLLLIIPGIIKTYAYALTEYILADDTVETDDAITLSRQWMNGHKLELFVIHLSFIGWLILSALTLGILHILYVGPYMEQTKAQFYLKVKAENKNIIG